MKFRVHIEHHGWLTSTCAEMNRNPQEWLIPDKEWPYVEYATVRYRGFHVITYCGDATEIGSDEQTEHALVLSMNPAQIHRGEGSWENLKKWYGNIDKCGYAYFGTVDCEPQNVCYNEDYYRGGFSSLYYPAFRKLEWYDWATSSFEQRRTRVRGPAWGYYLSKAHVDRLNQFGDFATEFMTPHPLVHYPTQQLHQFPSGAMLISMSDTPLDWLMPRCPVLDSDCIWQTLTWTWRRFRQAGMI